MPFIPPPPAFHVVDLYEDPLAYTLTFDAALDHVREGLRAALTVLAVELTETPSVGAQQAIPRRRGTPSTPVGPPGWKIRDRAGHLLLAVDCRRTRPRPPYLSAPYTVHAAHIDRFLDDEPTPRLTPRGEFTDGPAFDPPAHDRQHTPTFGTVQEALLAADGRLPALVHIPEPGSHPAYIALSVYAANQQVAEIRLQCFPRPAAVAPVTPPGPVLDETFDPHPGEYPAYQLIRVYRLAQDTLRVLVHRDATPEGSYAIAEVLDGRRWRDLVDSPAHAWHEHTPYRPDDPALALRPVADQLAVRAATILTATTTPQLIPATGHPRPGGLPRPHTP